jgi:hypothetical protein
MKTLTVRKIDSESIPALNPQIEVEWRYAVNYPYRPAGISALNANGDLTTPIDIVFDEFIQRSIDVRARFIGYASCEWFEIKTAPATVTMRGVIDVKEGGNPKNGDQYKLVVNLAQPIPAGVSFEWATDWTSTSNSVSGSGKYPPPQTYPVSSCNIGEGVVRPVAGSRVINAQSKCAEPSKHKGYVSKVVFFNVVAPAGFVFDLVPASSDLKFEVR